MPINKKRMISSFIKLVKTDSPSLKEKAVALKLKEIFKKLGAKVSFDSAGKKTGGDTGNLIAKFRGTRAGKPFLLSAHMDTVGPSKNIKPLVKPNKIISGGDTILGADCKAGIAIIIEIIKVLKESKTPYPPIEVLLTVSEEIGLLGAKSLNYSLIKSNCGIIFDSERPLNEITANAPAVNRVEIDLIGIACHSGACPEKGISAI
ncbi:MAG: M20/M25/M40 family metallo-hydrolase, partial [Elusimicrobiales bacterium]|nr:M20/M25/M40 family metallo-hydrolase [Elusimicrobiales bacterium]